MSDAGGVVTFLFTDLVGSTEVLDRLGDDVADELRRTHFSFAAPRGAVNIDARSRGRSKFGAPLTRHRKIRADFLLVPGSPVPVLVQWPGRTMRA